MFSLNRARYALAAALLAASACAGGHAVPPLVGDPGTRVPAPDAKKVDTTSVLKTLKKSVTIGSTVDAKNGDKFPHGLTIAPATYGLLKKNDLLACNFSNKAGAVGDGTTIEILAPVAGSKPKTFTQSSSVKGCGAVTAELGNQIWNTAVTGKVVAQFDQDGKLTTSEKGPQVVAPFGAMYAKAPGFGSYPPTFVFVTDAKTGSLLQYSLQFAPTIKLTVIAKGFPVNGKTGSATLGPSGLQYDRASDTLYILDGANNSLYAFTKASQILIKDAIVVNPGGKTFSGPEAKQAKLVYSGPALKSAVATALLPNGNLIVANTAGNQLVEITSAGQVLATKTVDTSSKPAVFGLLATGTSDANTNLFYTDANSNELIELTK